MYTTKKLKYNQTPELDMLAYGSGRVYSKVVSLLWKVKRKKSFWLSQGAVQKYMRLRGYQLHSQISSLWARLHEPIEVNAEPPISLSIEPLEILRNTSQVTRKHSPSILG